MEIVLNEIGLTIFLGVVILLTLTCMNLFNKTLQGQSYDQALEEKKRQKDSANRSKSKSPKSTPRKSTANQNKSSLNLKRGASSVALTSGVTNGKSIDEEIEREAIAISTSSSNNSKPRFKRAESLRNEHVVFADEISADDEKYSPVLPEDAAAMVSGILQNRSEKPLVSDSKDTSDNEDTLNTFEDIVPLDDMGLEIRRKSLQITPTNSRGNSARGSRTDLDQLGDEEGENEGGSLKENGGNGNHQKRILSFAESTSNFRGSADSNGGGSGHPVDARRICKLIRKTEMSDEEINQIIEIIIKKEEQNQWINTSSKRQSSILTKLKNEVESQKTQISEATELSTSLQSKLRHLRSDFSEEKSSLLREKKELEERLVGGSVSTPPTSSSPSSGCSVCNESNDEIDDLKRKVAELQGENQSLREGGGGRAGNDETDDLLIRLASEQADNKALTKTLCEQQGVIKTALKRIYPNSTTEGGGQAEPICQEHLQWFDQYVERIGKAQKELLLQGVAGKPSEEKTN